MRTARTPKNARATHDAQLVAIDSLKPYPGNARTHDLPVIRESLRVNGQYRPVVVRARTRHVLAGNGTLEAAIEEGWSEIWATFIDCDARAARRINLVDNRANDLAGWDEGLLAAQLGSLPGVEGTGWSERELVSFMAKVNGPGEDTAAVEPPKVPRTKPGDLWMLGEHRLLCGDVTKDVERLMEGSRADAVITDPPYGVDLVARATGKAKVTQASRLYDDDPDAIRALVRDAIPQLLATADRALIFPGTRMLWAYPEAAAVGCVFTEAGIGRCSWGFTCMHPILFYGKDPFLVDGRGSRANSFRHQASSRDHFDHPCSKPLLWMEWAVERASRPLENVLDPFAGSGSTLIACENLSRRCYAMEIDPGYCDVIVDRWQRHTGKQATRGG